MAKVFGHEIDLTQKQINRLLDLTDHDRSKTLQFINLMYAYEGNIKAKLLNDSSMQQRKNYTGEYVRHYFCKYADNHPNEKKMEKIKNVSLELGITSKAVEKHLYCKDSLD